jgi:DNA-binding LytR/AlgR family response regulator
MIRCLAIDDETLALDLLEDNIKQIPFLQLVKRCKNAYEAMQVLQDESIDLIFLDIQMPGITGMQFLQSLQSRPMVVFITAYKEYALEGFNLDVLDYLVKPVPFNRFLKATNKALEYHNLKQKPPSSQDLVTEYIFVNSEYNLVKIFINDITHVEGLKDYIKIHVATSNKPVITRMSLKAIEEKLPVSKFVRVHKSYIISIEKITSIRKNRIHLGTSEIPISDMYRTVFFKSINHEGLKT